MDKELLTKLLDLNHKFRANELAMRPVFLKLEEEAEKMKAQGLISDCDINIKVDAYTRNKKILKKYKIEEGDPVYLSYCVSGVIFKDDEFMHGNWSEEGDLGFTMCYSMHDFLYHHHIDRKDLLKIEKVYFDLTFNYQYLVNLKRKIVNSVRFIDHLSN